MFCEDCGAKVPAAEKFCPNCGVYVDAALAAPMTAEMPALKPAPSQEKRQDPRDASRHDMHAPARNQEPEYAAQYATSPSSPQDNSRSTPTAMPLEGVAEKAMTRYRDAYLVANSITTQGEILKRLGVIFAVSILVVTCIASYKPISNSQISGYVSAIVGVIVAIAVGTAFYELGVLVCAYGQMIKASLDTAVNGSPFMSDNQKAQVMVLVIPPKRARRAVEQESIGY